MLLKEVTVDYSIIDNVVFNIFERLLLLFALMKFVDVYLFLTYRFLS